MVFGSTVLAAIVAQLFHLSRPSRVSDKIGAIRDELEALRGTDDGTEFGKAARAVGLAAVEAAMINRLVPNRGLQNIGFVLLSVSALGAVGAAVVTIDPQTFFEHLVLWAGVGLYSIAGIGAFCMGIFGELATSHAQFMLSNGFRQSAETPGNDVGRSFDQLRGLFRSVEAEKLQHYRLRLWYQVFLAKSARIHLRGFMRELERPSMVENQQLSGYY